jgi:heme-degrading monooxygenase HmoA
MRMVISILTRKTRVTDRDQWQALLEGVLPKLKDVLKGETGFGGVEYLWSLDEPGRFAQITTWNSAGDCQNYVRGGGAATVATLEDAVIPTAPFPDGAWVRNSYERQ